MQLAFDMAACLRAGTRNSAVPAPEGAAARTWHFALGLIVFPLALALAGCATPYQMMPTPALYYGKEAKPLFTNVSPERRTPSLELLYVTDRAPASNADDVQPYTTRRSRQLAFGTTTVEFGDALTWDTLAKQSMSAVREHPVVLTLGPTKELARFPRIPYELAVVPTGIARTQTVVAAHEAAKKATQAEIAGQLASAPRKEVVLFVHGYANSFQDAALTMAELCHFLGREFVCAIFSWPAGARSLLLGYDVDRESGEFATEDLKKTIRIIAETPGLERLHVLAHSRGTDLVASALADLSVEAYITETTLPGRFKVGNAVLIAPDLDIDVAPSKILKTASDPDLPYGRAPSPHLTIPRSPEFRVTTYVSPSDKALAASGWLFRSFARLGRIEASAVPPEVIEQYRALALFDVVEVREAECFICHSYFVSNPRVSSDLIAMLRYRLSPNEPGRPLIEVAKPFWRVPTSAESPDYHGAMRNSGYRNE